jgi:hypothetical protein
VIALTADLDRQQVRRGDILNVDTPSCLAQVDKWQYG